MCLIDPGSRSFLPSTTLLPTLCFLGNAFTIVDLPGTMSQRLHPSSQIRPVENPTNAASCWMAPGIENAEARIGPVYHRLCLTFPKPQFRRHRLQVPCKPSLGTPPSSAWSVLRELPVGFLAKGLRAAKRNLRTEVKRPSPSTCWASSLDTSVLWRTLPLASRSLS